MATTTTSYGSITLVDLTDIGELSVYPTCNLPLSVIYNPDQSGSSAFNPNWGSNNLIIKPSIWYGGTQLYSDSTGLATGVTVTWKRQEGASSPTTLTTNESVVNGVLTVSANKFTENIPMLTYIIKVEYTEPTSNQTLIAEGQITFSLIKQLSTVKSATISGDSIFKYRGDGTIISAQSITLTGRLTGSLTMSGWKYKSGNSWVTYPNSTSALSLTVNATDDVFTNDVVQIKLETSDNTIYDIHTITKLKDGAAGQDTVTANLTNDSQMIPFDSSGQGYYDDAVSRIIIYERGEDKTNEWTISTSWDSNNITATRGTFTTANDSITVSGLVNDSGNITFRAQKTGKSDIIKTFSLVKVQAGENGQSPTIYYIKPTAVALGKSLANAFNPQTVTFNLFQKTGGTESGYAGRIKIYENVEASSITSSTTAVYASASDESTYSYQYTPTQNATNIVCELYKSGGFTEKVDVQTVAVAMEGQQGIQGIPGVDGTDAINIIVKNAYDAIPVSHDNKTLGKTITIGFSGYKGTTKVAATLQTPYPTILGISPTTPITQATANADGEIEYVIPANRTVSSVDLDGGNTTFTFLIEGNTVTYDFSWGINRNAKDGVNPVFLQLATPYGNYFNNGNGSLDITATLWDGNTDVSTTATYAWEKFVNGVYTTISGATQRTLSVNGSTVDGYASYKCTASYDGNSYVQYMSLIDKTDPHQVTVFSSVGDKLLNGNGIGALYAKVYRNGETHVELDPMITERFVTILPITGSNGDYCYLLNSTNKTVTLYKYTTTWEQATYSDSSAPSYAPSYTGTYNWYYRDKDGNVITNGTPSAGGVGAKVIYIDGTLINKKLIVDVRVTI